MLARPLAVLASLVLFACASAAPVGAQTEAAHPADATLMRLADAFDAKDAAAARALINDPWSGSRFWSGWSDDAWHQAATDLRTAHFESEHDGRRVYSISRDGHPREITMDSNGGQWRLDYNSFHGPFPHM